MLFREEREEREAPLRETWKEIQGRAQREEKWIRKALERAKNECAKLFEPEPPPFKYLGFKEPAEWQLFYTSLLERLIKTDTELKSSKK